MDWLDNWVASIFVFLLLAASAWAIRTGELPMRRGFLRRKDYPIVFFTMLAVYFLIAVIIIVCICGWLPTLIEWTK